MTRKSRSDSTQAATQQMKDAALEPIQPPAHIRLRKMDWPFWNSITCARPRDMWSDPDLENAANLARCKADIERIQHELDLEPDIVENLRGTQIINPKHALLETLTRRCMALSRMLHVHAEATGTKAPKESKAAEQARATRRASEKVADDDADGLIPGLRRVK